MKSSKRPRPQPGIAVVLAGHGSRSHGFDLAMRQVARSLKKNSHYASVSCAFLEMAEPSIPHAIQTAIKRGAREIRVMPFFVHLGKHVQSDIPRVLSEAQLQHPDVRISLSPYLGYDLFLARLVQKRLKQVKQRF